MDTKQQLLALESEVRAAGIRMSEVCRLAGIQQSQVSRWKSGAHEPRLSAITKLDTAFRTLLSNHDGLQLADLL